MCVDPCESTLTDGVIGGRVDTDTTWRSADIQRWAGVERDIENWGARALPAP